ncbi:MAG: hypothetical protein ACQERZ_05355 [Fusobacteriota bacterium]
METYLTHYFRKGTKPFQSLSALSDKKAIEKMKLLYQDNAIWGRFNNPSQYLKERRNTEKWLRNEFILKGGKPIEEYPIYMVLGKCEEIEKNMKKEDLEKIIIPIDIFKRNEVSFTYIDSMFSLQLYKNKDSKYYHSNYHGKIFMLDEIKEIIEKKGKPHEIFENNLPEDFFPYVETQVWNHSILEKYLCKLS